MEDALVAVSAPSINGAIRGIPRPLSATDLERRLAEEGVLVRGLSSYAMPEALRVTAGGAEAMRRFRDAFSRALDRLRD